jgi:uncharacterized NAD(P)/FAD-binding protein YdhS
VSSADIENIEEVTAAARHHSCWSICESRLLLPGAAVVVVGAFLLSNSAYRHLASRNQKDVIVPRAARRGKQIFERAPHGIAQQPHTQSLPDDEMHAAATAAATALCGHGLKF